MIIKYFNIFLWWTLSSLLLFSLSSAYVVGKPSQNVNKTSRSTFNDITLSAQFFDTTTIDTSVKRGSHPLEFPEMLEKKKHSYRTRTEWDGSKALVDRGRVVDFVWAGSTAILSPNPYSKGLAIAGMACSVTGWALEALRKVPEPKAVSYACSTLSFLGAFWNAWLSRNTIQQAYLDFIGKTPPGENFFSAHEMATMFTGGRTARDNSYFGQFEQKLANDTIKVFNSAKGILFHDPKDKYSVVTLSAMIGASKDKPATIAISKDLRLEHPYLKAWWETSGSNIVLRTHSVSLHQKDKLQKRLSHEGEQPCIDEIEEVEYSNDKLYACNERAEGEYPAQVMYGENFYGDEQQWERTDYNIGAEAGEDNGGIPFANRVMTDADANQWSDACLCLQDNGQWISTGAVQLARDGESYYGQDACYAGNCGADGF
ncbi:hypothetical protein E3Q10_04216 [Wallemia mellicola]|uniref:Uncharacterized protein n=1 Tax=Wallemia mellicola TaxID=1708541 RepID=A0A4T0MQ85_9BASI|nr:hypothetical protein E3Q19_04161 [Wallemia mellicola]TIC07403.1 hypothetical protein E3Q14_04285 [Wallemia mellicola]TIC23877.1 hypothetical protein E3Q10_04216 [Wallemia mellicola]